MSDGATQQPSVNILSQLQPLSHSDNSVSTEASSVYNSHDSIINNNVVAVATTEWGKKSGGPFQNILSNFKGGGSRLKTSTKSPSTSSTSINEVGIKSSDNSSPRLSSNSTERWDKKSQSGVAKIVSPSSSLANINGIVSVTASDSTSLESRSHDDSEVVELGRAQSPPAPSRRPIVANKIRPFSVTSTPLDKNLKQEYKSNSARSKSNSVSLNKNNGSNNDGGSFTVGAAQAIQNAGKPSSKVSIIVAPWVEFEDQVVVDGVSSPRLSLARPTISSSSAAKADAPIVTDHNISENFLGDGRASLGSKHSSEKQLQTEALSSSLLAGQSLASAANSSTDIVQATEEPELQRTSVESKRLIATYAVSRSHTFAKFDQTVFQFQLSLSTASNFLSVPKYMTLEQYNSRRSSFKSRIGDSIAVTVIYNGVTNTVKHYLEVPVNSTINEIRMEVLSKHNEASLQETYTITKLEDETSEIRLDANLPLDFLLQSKSMVNTDRPRRSSIIASHLPQSVTEELIFVLRKKTPPRFNVNFEIIINEKKKNRYILVSSQTTIKEVIDVIFSIEGLDGADRPKYALYREAIDSQKKKARYFELTETPFDITDSLSKFSFRDVASKRVNKLTSIFGFVDNSNVNDILTKEQQNNDDYKRKEEASRSLKLQHWLGIDANEKKSRSKQHKKSKSIDENAERTKVLKISTLGHQETSSKSLVPTSASPHSAKSFLQHGSPSSQKSMTLDSYSVALMQSDNLIIKESIDQHLLTEKQPNPPEIQILGTTSDPDLAGKSVKMKKSGTDSDGLFRKASLLLPSGIKHSRSSDSISIMSVDSRASNMDYVASSASNRKTAKLLDFFGVKAGEKETTMISNLARDKRVGPPKRQLAKKDNNFVARIYFGNLTYTSILLPMNATAENVVEVVKTKFNINEDADLYGIHVYYPQTGYEKVLGKTDVVFETMIKWEHDEIFVFKRKSLNRKLRASVAVPNDARVNSRAAPFISSPAVAGVNSEAPSSTSSESTPTTGPSGKSASSKKRVEKLSNFFGVQSGDGKGSSSKSKSDIKELTRLLHVMNKKMSVASLTHSMGGQELDSISSTHKERESEKAASSAANTKKEGWLVYINTQNLEQTCWVTMHNFMLSVKFTNSYSRNFPAAGLTNNNGDSNQQLEEDKSILLGDLSSSKLSPEKIGNLYVFSLEMKASATSKTNNDHAVSQFRFGAQTKEEAEEWISAITLAHRQRQQMEALAPPNPHVSINVDEVGDDQAHPLNDNYNGNNSNLSGQQSQEALIVAEDLELTTHWTTDIEQTRLSDFEFHKVLGRGKFAQVILCSQKSTSKVFAVKIVNRNEATGEHNVPVDNESKILRSLVHPFIVGLHFAFQSKDRLYLVMEYVNGGELFFHISNFGRFSEERVQFYSAEIMLAIEFLHSKGILYRDLKLENILLDKFGHIKVTDFGLSKLQAEGDEESSSQAEVTHVVGTLEYLAPELLIGERANISADWWAFGVVMFEMLCGYHPFYSDDRDIIKKNILQGRIEFPEFVSDDAAMVVAKLLVRKVERRLGTKRGAVDIKAQQFFASVDFEKMFRKEIKPPFEPELVDDFDVRFFDEVFTEEPIALSPIESMENLFDENAR